MNGTVERKRRKTGTDKSLTRRVEDLRERLQSVVSDRDELTDKIRKILAEYEEVEADVETIIEESKPRDPEEGFSDAVRGLKGTGPQRSHAVQTLRQMRLARNLTLRELAEAIGLPYPHLSEIERGLRFPLDEERRVLEEWAGGQLNFRFVPYVLIGPVKGDK